MATPNASSERDNLRQYFSLLPRELKLKLASKAFYNEKFNRKVGKPHGSPWAKYENDPVGFVTDILGDVTWSKQREICEALLTHRKVAVKSCHQSGKSWVVGRIPCWWISIHPPGSAFVVTSAPTFTQVETILWKEIGRAHDAGKLLGRTNRTNWIIGKEIVALGRKPEDASPTAFQGLHAQHMLVLFDEAGGMPHPLWTAADTLIANEGASMLVIGNPDDPATEFYNICKPGSGWHVITISAFDTPNFTGEDVPDIIRKVLISKDWAEEKKKKWGEDSPLYKSKVLGEFPDASEDALVPPRLVTAAVNRELPSIGPQELGVDVARFGRNESVIYYRQGPVARLLSTSRNRDTMHLTGLIVKCVIDNPGITKIKIDDIGVGGGVTDRLKELKNETNHCLQYVDIVPINVGTAAASQEADERFANLKSELSWNLRERFISGSIDLDTDEDTQAQICAIKYTIKSNGKMYIESKEETEKRLTKLDKTKLEATVESGSPDRFDALVLCFGDVKPEGYGSLWTTADLIQD